MTINSPRACAELAETTAALPPGNCERFAGYAVMGMPFSSGHYLAFRRFPASSVGPAYTAVWLYRPTGGWTIYADAPPEVSCARYFGAALAGTRLVETRLTEVRARWEGPFALTVGVPGVVRWDLEFKETRTTAALTSLARRLPEGWWQRPGMLGAMGRFMGPALHAGKMKLGGTVPNGQTYQARPLRVWAVKTSHATVDGTSAGTPKPLPKQLNLADFWLPQEGLFVAEMSLYFPSTAPETALETTQETAGNRSAAPIAMRTRRVPS